MKEFRLNNGISAVYKENKNTPRIALSFSIAITEEEKFAGIYSLMTRLLMQGTKNRSAEQIANELEENAIEFCVDMKQDYLRFRFLCLNEDIAKSIEILADIVNHSTFEDFEKELDKMTGEIVADLDFARTKIFDAFAKTIFENHVYGHTYTKILENIDKLNKADVKDAYKTIVKTGKKVIAVVGDTNFELINNLLNKYFGTIDNDNIVEKTFQTPELTTQKNIEVIKEDAQQAQIIQGWLAPTIESSDYPALAVLNTILGSCGLSSRLFLELRDKKGLAYVVRSSYETYKACSTFSIYIATEPKNIDVSLAGFKEEIDKIKNILVSEEELQNAKNNILGKHEFIVETNAQQANLMAYYGINNLPFDFDCYQLERVKNVTAQQIQDCANKYFNENFVLAILKP